MQLKGGLPGHTLSGLELYGIGEPALVDCEGFRMRGATAEAFVQMRDAAARDGLTLAVTSAYRSFERQLAIWNAKAMGEKPLLDDQGQPLAFSSLDDNNLIDAILQWSALPGCSRHHWGTDIDVYDAAAIERHTLKLEPAEYAAGGPCHRLSQWLKANASHYGFFLPFQAGKSGVNPEPWHLSFAPQAEQLITHFDVQTLHAALSSRPIALKPAVLARLDELVTRYVMHYAPPG